jgi:nucleotide-binding universal stress UspA family protein
LLAGKRILSSMGYYPEELPRHGHRNPSELAEDELLSSLHGEFCGLPATEGVQVAAAKPSSRFEHLFRPDTPFRLLVAIENDDNATAAIRMADALTTRGAIPTLITATELMAPAPDAPNSMFSYTQAVLDEDFHHERCRSLRALITATTGKRRDWPVASIMGPPALVIVEETKSRQAELLVIGIHQHGTLEQAIGENTATRVIAKVGIPVLGVRRTMRVLPRRIMVATDFGNASREAAHLAANLASPGGSVVLVHVDLGSPIVDEGDEGATLVQREGIEHAFVHLAQEVGREHSIRVETVRRSGDPASQLMAAAAVIGPDLIAIAAQRRSLVARLLVGSVTRTLLREGRWPMLVTPAGL